MPFATFVASISFLLLVMHPKPFSRSGKAPSTVRGPSNYLVLLEPGVDGDPKLHEAHSSRGLDIKDYLVFSGTHVVKQLLTC